MRETEVLANYVGNAKYEDLPVDVVDRVKKSVLDTVACGLGGRRSLEGNMLIDIMESMGGTPEATVMGDKTRLSFMQAAQINRVITNILDYDDTLPRVGHTSTAFVPVALAIAERIKTSGKELINAIVLGNEVIARIRDAVNPSEEVFWKTFERIDSGLHFGVTIVAAKLFGLNGAQIADALGLAGRVRAWRITRPDWAKRGMPRWMKVTGGDITIPGIHAAMLAKRGFPGDRAILDQESGYEVSVGSDRYDASRLTANLGKDYATLRIGYKAYASCRHTSSTLDAVAAIASKNNIKIGNVQQVIVRVQKLVSDNFAIYEPEYMIQAQFSIPYVVTMVLMGEPTGPDWYKEDMLKNPQVREFQHKIMLEEDPIATKKVYTDRTFPSTVKMITKDGKSFTKHIEYPKGDPQNPFGEQDHINKLTNMASYLGMNQSRIDKLIDTLNRLEKLDTISELASLLVP